MELTSGDLCRCLKGLGRVVRRPDRGTEVSRGHSRRGNEPVAAQKAVLDPEDSPVEGPNGPHEGINGEVSRMRVLWV